MRRGGGRKQKEEAKVEGIREARGGERGEEGREKGESNTGEEKED